MSSFATGYPDDQERPLPLGEVFLSENAKAIPAAAATYTIGPYPVAGYAAVLLQYVVATNPVTAVLTWSLDGAVGAGATSVQTVTLAVGTGRQVITNQGHVLDSVAFSGSGGAATLSYALAGANPLPASGGAATCVDIDFNTHHDPFTPTAPHTGNVVNATVSLVTYNSHANHFPCDPNWYGQDAGGSDTAEVDGLYLYHVGVEWPAFAGDRYVTIDCVGRPTNRFEPMPVARGLATPADDIQVISGLVYPSTLPLSFRTYVYQASGVTQTLVSMHLTIARLSSVS